MSELTPVTMNLSETTLNRVEYIKAISGQKNRTRIVAAGVELLKECIKARERGARIVIEEQDGSKQSINIF